MSVAQPLSVIGTGALIAIAGVLIKCFGYTNLIAGYDPNQVTDEEALADFVGTYTLVIAVLTIAVGVADYLTASNGTSWYWYVYTGFVIIIAGWMIKGARRYESPEDDTSRGASP